MIGKRVKDEIEEVTGGHSRIIVGKQLICLNAHGREELNFATRDT
jgi:hypothetical protein